MPADGSSPRAAPVYLDHAAATPLRPEVALAMAEAQAAAFANPSSPHALGRRARALLEEARERILAALGGRATGPHRDRLVFTSGATEANRLGVLGTAGTAPGRVLVSAREHASVTAAAADLARRGWQMMTLPLDESFSVVSAVADAAGHGGHGILCVTPVCGQTGSREAPAVFAAAAAAGLLVHADATQAVAWDDAPFAAWPVTSLACAPHKFGGPRGTGALVVRGGVALAPVVPGPQELGARGGTESVVLAVGFARALELAVVERARAAERVAALRDRLEREVVAAATSSGLDAVVVAAEAPRAPHIATVAFPGLDRQALVMAADLAGVCLATGTACASGSSEPAPALVAAGLPARVAGGAVRASVGHDSSDGDVTTALERLEGVFRGLGRSGLQATAGGR
jgi:cysteine desulfurase